MVVLAIRTDKLEAEIYIYEGSKQVAAKTWEAHRQLAESLHTEIKQLLAEYKKDWTNIQGIVCFKGPGSFTGLRIGLSVANSLAYSLNIPIVGTTNMDWVESGLKQLAEGKNQEIVKPEYGAEAHITQPKK